MTDSSDSELISFIEHAREKGMDHATIRQMLISSGWKEKDIADAFTTTSLDLPIPKPKNIRTVSNRPRTKSVSPWPRRAREAFFHLLTFGSLFSCATSVIILFFIYVDFAFPDPAWQIGHARLMELFSIIRFQLAVVIVSFPVFLVLWHYLLREVQRDSEKGRGAIRRWLGYLSIFIGALTISGDAMTLIYFTLEGQLTTRLILKSAVLFLIAGSLVGYLSLTLRSESKTESSQ